MTFLMFWDFSSASAQSNYSIQKALQTAKSNNIVLKSQQLNINIAETDIVTAMLRPNLKLNNQTLQLMRNSAFAENTSWYNGQNRQVWWQLTKVFQLPAQRRNKIDFSKQNVALQQKIYNETERSVLQDVANKWLDVWTIRKQLDILLIAKTNVDTLVIINKLRLKNQVTTQTDLTRTELLANKYGLQIITAKQNYKNELANLKFLLGIQNQINNEITIDTTDNFNFVFPSNLDSLLKQALDNRSDLQAVKSTIDVANANIKLQKSFSLPQPELGVIYNPQNTVPYVGIYGTIDIPIFARNQGEIKKSSLLKQQAEQNLLVTQLQIQVEITNAFNSYQTQKTNLQKFNVLLAQSEGILSSVRYAYLRGSTTIIDFLEAQRSWLETQQQYYETLQQYRQSYIRLLYTSGLINQMAQ
jgi:outer membrane protein, heavy metal efflux system